METRFQQVRSQEKSLVVGKPRPKFEDDVLEEKEETVSEKSVAEKKQDKVVKKTTSQKPQNDAFKEEAEENMAEKERAENRPSGGVERLFKKKKKRNGKSVTIYLDEDNKEAIDKIAKENNLSTSSIINQILADFFENN